jgi:hypothetical protein
MKCCPFSFGRAGIKVILEEEGALSAFEWLEGESGVSQEQRAKSQEREAESGERRAGS